MDWPNPQSLISDLQPLMKIALTIFGILLALMGSVFFLQGINILPGSFMTGQIQWAINGSIMIVVGVGLAVFAQRRPAPPKG